MDNQTHNTENDWVDRKLAGLAPPADWNPNSKRAYNEFLKRRDGNEPTVSSSWIRISMAAAILASIVLVVALLPWNALWKPAAKSSENRIQKPEPVKAPTPVAVPEPAPQQTAKLTQPALAQPDLSQPPALGPGTGGAIPQTAAAAQDPEQKPAERVGPRATPPRAILSPEPGYTDEARQAHIQGTVVLDVIVRKDGTGKVQKVVQGLGYGLDEKAIEAFEKWTFTPGTIDGKPVDVRLLVTINFHLY